VLLFKSSEKFLKMVEPKILPSAIPLPLNPKELEEVVTKAKDYALMHGICMRSKDNFNPDLLQVCVRKFQGHQHSSRGWVKSS
jgi:hypothetical protein